VKRRELITVIIAVASGLLNPPVTTQFELRVDVSVGRTIPDSPDRPLPHTEELIKNCLASNCGTKLHRYVIDKTLSHVQQSFVKILKHRLL
jgi:hypothetical protein